MSRQIKALKLALEKIERFMTKQGYFDDFADEITAIREALVEPVAETVAAARKIAADYKEPDNQIDSGNLYHALMHCIQFIDAQNADIPECAGCGDGIANSKLDGAHCWKCGDSDPTFQARCDVPTCEMRAQQAQPQQEPDAWLWITTGNKPRVCLGGPNSNTPKNLVVKPLYTAPPQRKPLSDDQALDLLPTNSSMSRTDALLWVLRATERAHGIKDSTK